MATIDTGDRKSFDVQLNIVPFIDLMSCLTAFLLVTAVWSDHAQVPAHHRGRGAVDGLEPPRVAVLVEHDRIRIEVSRMLIAPVIAYAAGGDHDWDTVAAALVALHGDDAFVDRHDIQIAADSLDGSAVPYRDLVRLMDVAAAAGFDRAELSAPRDL